MRDPVMTMRLLTTSAAVLLLAPLAAAQQVEPDLDALRRESYQAHLAAAHASLRLGETAALRRWLDGAPEELRGFEWRWLGAASDESLRAVALDVQPYAIDLDGTGKRVAVGAGDGSVALRDLQGRVLVRTAGHADATLSVQLGPTGERLLSSSADRTVKVWGARTGELLVDFSGHGYPVGGACFSPDGELVASSSYERDPERGVVGTVHLWHSDTGELVRTLEAGRKPIVDVRFSPDGARLAAASWDFCVYLWDLLEQGEPRVLALPEEGRNNAVGDVAFAPDGRRVAAVSKDHTARVWDSASGELVLTLRGHDNDVTCVAFSPDGELLATGSTDQTVRLWGTADGASRGMLRGHVARVDDLAFGPDGMLFSAGSGGTLREWDPTVDWYGGVLRRTTDACYAAAFSPDGRRVATCSSDGRIQQWDVDTWDQLAAWQAHPQESSCHALAWTPDGRRLLSGSYDRTVAIWDALTLEELGRLQHEAGLHALALAPDGVLLATTQPTSVWLWDLGAREHVRSVEGLGSTTVDLAFSSDGAWLAIANRDKSVRIVDPASASELARLELEAEPHAVAFAPNGATLALGVGSTVRLIDTSTWQVRSQIQAGDDTLVRLAWSPWGDRLAASSAFVPLLDPRASCHLVTLRPQAESGWHLSWSPVGERLATAALDGTLAITDALPMRVRLKLRDMALRERPHAQAWVDRQLAEGRSLAEIAGALDVMYGVRTHAYGCALTVRAAAGRR